MHWNFYFQTSTCNFIEKAKFFKSNFITEKLLRIGFERRVLQKMANWHSCYKKSFQRTYNVK